MWGDSRLIGGQVGWLPDCGCGYGCGTVCGRCAAVRCGHTVDTLLQKDEAGLGGTGTAVTD